MMSIDDMLSQVAKITGSTPPKPQNEAKKSVSVHNAKLDAIGLITKHSIGLDLAREIIYCVEKGARMMGLNAVIAIVNGDGGLIALEAMDNSYVASVKVAQDKAYTAAALKMPTEVALEESRGGAFDGLSNGNGILLLGGGRPLTVNGEVVGAIGVSGGTKEEDITLAEIGVRYLNAKLTQ